MSAKSNYLEESLINHVFRGVAFPTLGGSLHIALSTADPGESGSGLAEPSGNNYSRVAVSRATGQWKDPASATQGTTNNTNAVSFPQASGSWGTITHVAIMDAATGGNILYKGALAVAKTVTSGDTFVFQANQISILED